MPLVPAKCPECGGLVEVDNEKRAGLCQHCGEPFVVEDAIQTFNTYYQTTNNYNTTHNYGEGAVVNVYEDTKKDFVIEAGVLKEYHGESVDVVIPEGVKSIDENCFKDMSIESIRLPSSLKELNDSLICIRPLLNTVEVSEENDVYYVDGNALIHNIENNKKTIEYIAGNRDSYTIPNDVYGMNPKSYYSLNHLYWSDYDLHNLPCREESIVEIIKNKFPYTIMHHWVDYQCKDCGKYNFGWNYDYIYFEAGARIWFAGTEIAQLEIGDGSYMKLFHYNYNKIKDSLLNKMKNIKKLVLLSLNSYNKDFHFAYSSNESPNQEQIGGYSLLFELFSSVTELIIEQDTTYYTENREKCFSVLEDIIKNSNILDKCSNLTFGKEVPKKTKKKLADIWMQKLENIKKQKIIEEKQKIVNERKNNGLCQHCGGTFKGLFSSKCSICGKPKDY